MSQRNTTQAELLEAMTNAALEAGRAIHEIYLGSFEVRHKADQSPVTEADHAAEAIILERLRQIAPDIPIVAEEEVAAGRLPQIGSEFFLVDPLDGTKEFVQRIGDFTVNIALIRDGDPVLGGVYAPVTSALYVGDVVSGIAVRSHRSTGPCRARCSRRQCVGPRRNAAHVWQGRAAQFIFNRGWSAAHSAARSLIRK